MWWPVLWRPSIGLSINIGNTNLQSSFVVCMDLGAMPLAYLELGHSDLLCEINRAEFVWQEVFYIFYSDCFSSWYFPLFNRNHFPWVVKNLCSFVAECFYFTSNDVEFFSRSQEIKLFPISYTRVLNTRSIQSQSSQWNSVCPVMCV